MPSGLRREPSARKCAVRVAALLVGAAACTPRIAAAQSLPASRPLESRGGGWRFLPGLSIAYDSFGQRYVVTDDDTLDLFDELSARLNTAFEHQGRTWFLAQNVFGYGQEATRDDLVMRFERFVNRRWRLHADQELRYKAYAANSGYSYSHDYLVGTTRAAAVLMPGRGWQLRLDDRFEFAWFDSTDRYNYPYRLNDTGGEIERDYGFLSRVRLGYAYGTRAVPDSTAIAYRRQVAVAEWQHEIGLHGFSVENRLERRRYGDPVVRSDFWDYSGVLSAHVNLQPALRLRPEYRATATHYDLPDSVWSNYNLESVEMLIEGDPSSRTVLAIGPRGEFRRTSGPIDRAYNQWGIKGSVTFSTAGSLWLQFTDEIGLRRHFAGDDLLYSDYTFNWSTLYVSWQPRPRIGFDLFFSLNPESHQDRLNDTTTMLLSTSVTYGWR